MIIKIADVHSRMPGVVPLDPAGAGHRDQKIAALARARARALAPAPTRPARPGGAPQRVDLVEPEGVGGREVNASVDGGRAKL